MSERDAAANYVIVRDPEDGESDACVYLPRFNAWRCGACVRGFVEPFIGDKCPYCSATVIAVQIEGARANPR